MDNKCVCGYIYKEGVVDTRGGVGRPVWGAIIGDKPFIRIKAGVVQIDNDIHTRIGDILIEMVVCPKCGTIKIDPEDFE